jgi:hypothetical protein
VVTFAEIKAKIGDLSSSAVHVVEALAATGHVADTPDAKKGAACTWVNELLHPWLAAHGLAIAEPLIDKEIDAGIEWALGEAEHAAGGLPGGFGKIVADLLGKLG